MADLQERLHVKNCCGKELLWSPVTGCIDHKVNASRCDNCGAIYEERETGKVTYVLLKPSEDYTCGTCGAKILAVTIIHSIHGRPEVLAGSGRVVKEYVPYCPNCEEKPNFTGSFITPP